MSKQCKEKIWLPIKTVRFLRIGNVGRFGVLNFPPLNFQQNIWAIADLLCICRIILIFTLFPSLSCTNISLNPQIIKVAPTVYVAPILAAFGIWKLIGNAKKKRKEYFTPNSHTNIWVGRFLCKAEKGKTRMF